MAIDTTKIEGYENMTVEEKIKALEGFDFETPTPDYTGYVKKELFDKTSSELAQAKKDLKARMSEEEIKKNETEALLAKYKEEAETLKKEKSISENKATLISIGYDDTLADETAKAMVEGDLATVLKNQQTLIESVKKIATGNAMAGVQNPNGKQGDGNKTITKEQFNAMSLAERQELFTKNKELYNELKN